MRIGVFLLAAQFPEQSHTAVLESTLAAACAAEEAGFDGVWLAEHHFMSYGVCPSALTMAAFVLGRTSRVHVGTAVSVLSTQHPVALAEQALLLDQVSGGRFRLGVGRGGPWVDLEVFGTGLERYEKGFAESLELLLAALRGGVVRAEGARFGFREVEIVPGPRTGPHPPLLVAATSEATVGLAAGLGLPLLLGMHQRPHEQAAGIASHTDRARRAVDGHVVTSVAHVADSDEAARAVLLESLPAWLGPGLAGHVTVDGRPGPTRDPVDYARFLCDTSAVGSAATCVRRLAERVRTTGAEEVIVLVEGAGQEKAVLANIRRLGAEVLPELRAVLA